MTRYWYELTDNNNKTFGCHIADGNNKQTAVNAAKRYMKENGINYASLVVNSMKTNNLIDIIDIEL